MLLPSDSLAQGSQDGPTAPPLDWPALKSLKGGGGGRQGFITPLFPWTQTDCSPACWVLSPHPLDRKLCVSPASWPSGPPGKQHSEEGRPIPLPGRFSGRLCTLPPWLFCLALGSHVSCEHLQRNSQDDSPVPLPPDHFILLWLSLSSGPPASGPLPGPFA